MFAPEMLRPQESWQRNINTESRQPLRPQDGNVFSNIAKKNTKKLCKNKIRYHKRFSEQRLKLWIASCYFNQDKRIKTMHITPTCWCSCAHP